MGLFVYFFPIIISLSLNKEWDKEQKDLDLQIEETLRLFPNHENFDIFEYSEEINNDTLLIYKLVDFALNDLIGRKVKIQIVEQNKLNNFLSILSIEYNSNTNRKMNPYHNIFHASNVVQNLYLYLLKSKNNIPLLFEDTYNKQKEEKEIQTNINYRDLDIFALIIAAACHDFRHPGRDKNFYKNYKDKVPFAKILKEYDYKLEPYHFEESKKLIEKMGLLELLNKYQKERFYKIMQMAIYGTDNSINKKHAEDIITYKDIINTNSINLAKEKIKSSINLNINTNMKNDYANQAIDDIKLTIFGAFLHAADISISTKSRYYFIIWSDRISEERCEQSKEIHSIDQTKEINCIGKDEEKYRESVNKFFENIGDIFFIPFCEVFSNLNYLCEYYEKNKKFFQGKEKIHK